jgi:ferrochelatase
VEHTLEGLAAEGHRHVLMAPIGFLSDHVEINYDIDIDFKAVAKDLGMELSRTPMLNAGAALAATLAALVDEQLN